MNGQNVQIFELSVVAVISSRIISSELQNYSLIDEGYRKSSVLRYKMHRMLGRHSWSHSTMLSNPIAENSANTEHWNITVFQFIFLVRIRSAPTAIFPLLLPILYVFSTATVANISHVGEIASPLGLYKS